MVRSRRRCAYPEQTGVAATGHRSSCRNSHRQTCSDTASLAGCVAGARTLRRPGVPNLLALVAILGTACLLHFIGVPVSLAAPTADTHTPSPTPAVSAATQHPSSPESLQPGPNADIQPTPETKVDDLEPGKPPPPIDRVATSNPTPTPVAATTADAEPRALLGTPVLLGHSVQGRAIRSLELGAGPRWLAVIGGIHQGNEANSTVLANLLLDHFRNNLAEIPYGVGLAFIPDLNPDGAAAGTRENANGVDLNRNWDAGWQADAYGPSGLVPGAGGTRPFSEPETRALARYLLDRPFVAAIFLHSRGGFVVPGPGGGSVELASTIARAAQYTYLRGWTAYPLSGQSSKYLVPRGIHVAIVELTTHTDPDFPQNLQGLRAALAWAQHLPAPIGFQLAADAEFANACNSRPGTFPARLASPLCPW